MKILKILLSVMLIIGIAAGPDLVLAGTTDTQCPAGDDGNTCNPASAPTCSDGQMLNTLSCSCVADCPTGTVEDNGQCVRPASGSGTGGDDT